MGFQGSGSGVGWGSRDRVQASDGVPDERDGSHDVNMTSNEPSPSSVDFRPAYELAWAGCQSIARAGVNWLSPSLFFPLGAGLFHLRWNCSYNICNIMFKFLFCS
ncbi:hypothetical protein ACFX15_019665 [Malus domestica]